MIVALLMLVLAVAGVFVAHAEPSTYGSSLEQYIAQRNPQHAGDIERLTIEYNTKISKGLL